MKHILKAGAITLVLAFSTGTFANSMLYWSNWVDQTISRASIDGSNVQIIYDGFFRGRGIAADSRNGFIYWPNLIPNGSSYDTVFYRAKLNGTEKTEIFRFTNKPLSCDIALDPTHQKIYWIAYVSPNYNIMRANLDGTDTETVVSTTVFVHDLELDIDNNYIYWSTWFGKSIWRANLDGTNASVIFTCTYSNPEVNHIALSPEKDYLYATVRTNYATLSGYSYIFKIDTNAPHNSTIVSDSFPTAITYSNRFKGIVVNPQNNRIYFNATTADQRGPAAIYSCNPDGSDLQTVVSGLTGEPWALLIATEPECVNPPISDLNGDCTVNLIDFSMLASDWLNTYSDLSLMATEWLDCGLEPGYECQ